MRILKFGGKLVEEIGRTLKGDSVVFLKYIREEDKDKCPHCGKPIEKEISIVEGCRNWNEAVEGVETLKSEGQ
jgi:hypothetical protein